MSNVIRGKVSKINKRFQTDGFDLDLAYIHPRIIAMGYPSENVRGLYRNNLSEVQRFLNHFHPGHCKVFNLCSEHQYHKGHFFSVSEYPFADHTAPPFEHIINFCIEAEKWLQSDPQNIIAVHCKAGKGRTGLMVSCLLMHLGIVDHKAEEALAYFGENRTQTGEGVTIPSQKRFVGYYASVLQGATFPLRQQLHLHKLKMFTVPNFDIGGGCDPFFTLSTNGVLIFKTKPLVLPSNADVVEVDFGVIAVSGLIRLDIDDKDITTDDHIGHIWLHSDFIPKATCQLTFAKTDIDGACKQKEDRFHPNFKLELYFRVV